MFLLQRQTATTFISSTMRVSQCLTTLDNPSNKTALNPEVNQFARPLGHTLSKQQGKAYMQPSSDVNIHRKMNVVNQWSVEALLAK